MTNKHTATLPNGHVATRTSANRTYTHAIAVARTAATVLREFEASLARWDATPETDDWRQRKASIRYFDAIRKDVEAARAAAPGDIVWWDVVGWAGRPDLAEKAAASHRGKWDEVRILPAELTVK